MLRKALSRIGENTLREQNSNPSKVKELRRRYTMFNPTDGQADRQNKSESDSVRSILDAKPPGSPAPDPRWSETRGISPTENPGQADRQNKSESDSVRSILNAKPGDPAYPGSPAAFDPRTTSSLETPGPLPKELNRRIQEGTLPPGVVRSS